MAIKPIQFSAITLDQVDLDFIFAQLLLPGNDPRNATGGTILDSLGIRDVQGVGNNVLNPTWGSADYLFPRLTIDSTPYVAEGVLNQQFQSEGTPTSYAVRGTNLVDTQPRIVSNLISNQDGGAVFQPLALTELQAQDNPSVGRLSPLTGATNPLPNSSYLTFFGQFFDHGLDFVKKGAEGFILIPLLPGDPLYVDGSLTNFMVASRSNTATVSIGIGSTDELVTQLGLSESRTFAVLTGSAANPTTATGGTLVLNGTLVTIAAEADVYGVRDALNAATHSTNVIASVDKTGHLVLTPRAGESENTTSPFIDLSQAYGSAPSHTVFLREYDDSGTANGRLVSGADGGMPSWAIIKENASNIGITLHDYNVLDVPLVRMNADGTAHRDPVTGVASLVAQNVTTGEVVFVQDSAKDLLSAANLTLVTTGHAFLDDMAHDAMSSGMTPNGNLVSPSVLDEHLIAGDGRANENLALTAIHEVFHGEHNTMLAQIKDMVALRNDAASWTEEMYFQAAKLVTEMEYQHVVFGEFARKFSPNVTEFAGYDVTIDPAITAEFANAVYRFGHSMLTDTVAMEAFNPDTGLATGEDHSMTLIEAFLNPTVFNHTVAGEVAIGSSNQVAYAIDEWVTGSLRNTLVGLPLDLAALNIARGRDAGIPSLNEVRQQLFDQTGMTSLKPYASWEDFGLNLLHQESLKNFIAAYAADEILLKFAPQHSSVEWGGLQKSGAGAVEYATALSAAADAALNDASFMSQDQGFQNIDLWIGGLAEAKVEGGQLGSTFDFVFATQMTKLQGADRFYYLERLDGTNLLANIEGQLLSDIVMRNTGVQHLYTDIFSVADSSVEMSSHSKNEYNTLFDLRRDVVDVKDETGAFIQINRAGYVGDTFYGNTGSYVDARGVLNPNGNGNASETIGGTDLADKINAMGGNDTVWADGGDDNIEGGNGSDFLHGGDGNDTITDSQGDDFIWGDAGDDVINAGGGLDQVFGGAGDDLIYGGLGADFIDGGIGNDILYGDTSSDDVNGDGDEINGGAGNDVLWGGGGANRLDGGIGDDILHSGAGTDRMVGGLGDDLFVMHAVEFGFNNRLDGGLGYDVVDYSGSIGSGVSVLGRAQGINVNLSSAGVAVIPVGILKADSFLGVESAIGSRFDDTLIGGVAVGENAAGVRVRNVEWDLKGRAGNDYLEGGPGNDNLDGGDGVDTVSYRTAPAQQVVNPVTQAVTAVGVTINLASTIAQNTVTAGTDTLTGIENVIGSAFNDTLTGDGAANVIEGGDGADLINGAGGADTAGYEHAAAGINVNLALNGGQNTISAGIDTLISMENVIGSGFNDTLTGNGGANVMEGGVGNDLINGGAGSDTASYEHAAAGVNVNLELRVAQVTGGAGTDTLRSMENLRGSVFNDILTGSAGANVLDGNIGADIMSGGGGNDTYMVDNAADVVNEAAGAGTDTILTSLNNFSLLPNARVNLENLTFTGLGDFVGTGNALANALTGGAGNDILSGGAGNDTLDGGIGSDVMAGGIGNDTYLVDNAADIVNESLSEGNDTVNSSISYSLGLGVENLVLIGTVAIDGAGNALVNSLTGNAANNVLDGGGGADVMSGGGGNDTYIVDNTADVVNETVGAGTDSIQTSLTTYSLALAGLSNVENLTFTGSGSFNGSGNASANILTGGVGADVLSGGAGNDTLIGNGGADRLTGGVGRDVFWGGDGNDTFVFALVGDSVLVNRGAVGGVTAATVTQLEVIMDFAQGDRIDLSAIDARSGLFNNGNQAFSLVNGAFTTANQNGGLHFFEVTNGGQVYTVVEASNDGDTAAEFQIALQGSHALSAADFVL
jgi:Ca2+-binding RTX toxin-like protein